MYVREKRSGEKERNDYFIDKNNIRNQYRFLKNKDEMNVLGYCWSATLC